MRLTSKNGLRSPIDGDMINVMYNKLVAYEDAEEQGLLVRLPCNANIVYIVPKTLLQRVTKHIAASMIVVYRKPIFALTEKERSGANE